MTATLIAIALLVATAVGVFLGRAFRPKRKPTVPVPKHTANEVKNDNASGKAAAIKAAADEHDVPASVVADDLEWLDPDV